MADRIEREINEILEKLEGLPDEGAPPDRRPISIAQHREQRERRPDPPAPRISGPSLAARLSPTHALLAGAGTVIGGLVLSNIWAPLIWAAFAGVAMFVGGFVAALFKTPRPRAESRDGVFWRDRYIEYSGNGSQTTWGRIKRRFRR